MSNLTIDEENPLQMFLNGLRAAESKRQYPRRLKVFLDYLTTKGELMTELLQDQCEEFILKTKENPKWANNQLMEFVLFQKNQIRHNNSWTLENQTHVCFLMMSITHDSSWPSLASRPTLMTSLISRESSSFQTFMPS